MFKISKAQEERDGLQFNRVDPLRKEVVKVIDAEKATKSYSLKTFGYGRDEAVSQTTLWMAERKSANAQKHEMLPAVWRFLKVPEVVIYKPVDTHMLLRELFDQGLKINELLRP